MSRPLGRTASGPPGALHRGWVALAVCGCLCALPLQGRLGEDEAACDLRYNANATGQNRRDIPQGASSGQLITGPGTRTREYTYEGWVITIGFRNGWAARMRFEHQQPPNSVKPSRISDEELRAILTANTMGYAWREIPLAQADQIGDSIKEDAGRVGRMLSRLWLRTDGAVAFVLGDLWSRDVLYLEDATYVKEKRLQPKAPPPEASAPKPIPKF